MELPFKKYEPNKLHVERYDNYTSQMCIGEKKRLASKATYLVLFVYFSYDLKITFRVFSTRQIDS